MSAVTHLEVSMTCGAHAPALMTNVRTTVCNKAESSLGERVLSTAGSGPVFAPAHITRIKCGQLPCENHPLRGQQCISSWSCVHTRRQVV